MTVHGGRKPSVYDTHIYLGTISEFENIYMTDLLSSSLVLTNGKIAFLL